MFLLRGLWSSLDGAEMGYILVGCWRRFGSFGAAYTVSSDVYSV